MSHKIQLRGDTHNAPTDEPLICRGQTAADRHQNRPSRILIGRQPKGAPGLWMLDGTPESIANVDAWAPFEIAEVL